MPVEPFLDQLRRTRILAWTIVWLAILFFAATCAGLSGWPWRVEGLRPWLVRTAGDNWINNAFEIQRIRKDARRGVHHIVYIGGSACLEGITSDDDVTKQFRSLHGASNIRFASICSPYQNFADEARIVHALGNVNGAIVLGTEPLYFEKKPSRQFRAKSNKDKVASNGYFYLPIPSDLKDVARNVGVYVPPFFDVFEFWRLAPKHLFEAAWRRWDRPGPIPKVKRHRIKKYRNVDYKKVGDGWRKHYFAYADMNQGLREVAMRYAVQNSNELVLVEIPNNENLRFIFQSWQDDYRTRLQALKRKVPFTYIEMQGARNWTGDLFFDTHHLSPSGRTEFTKLFATSLARQLKNLGRPE